MRVLLALGGNALARDDGRVRPEDQVAAAAVAMEAVADLVTHDVEVVLTHGNGPQVGVLALQSAADPHLTTLLDFRYRQSYYYEPERLSHSTLEKIDAAFGSLDALKQQLAELRVIASEVTGRVADALHEATGEAAFLAWAQESQTAFDRHYANPETGGYFLTADDAEGLPDPELGQRVQLGLGLRVLGDAALVQHVGDVGDRTHDLQRQR